MQRTSWSRFGGASTLNNEQIKDLCLSLMEADTEERVVSLLEGAGYWRNEAVWRNYGDNESNFSTIGNQSSRSDAALVEKLINSVDHRLINDAWLAESTQKALRLHSP